jgi:hypothetical protein
MPTQASSPTFSSNIACKILDCIENYSDMPPLAWSNCEPLTTWDLNLNQSEQDCNSCNLCLNFSNERIKKQFMWDIEEDFKIYVNLSICYVCYIKSYNIYTLFTNSDLTIVRSHDAIAVYDKEDKEQD